MQDIEILKKKFCSAGKAYINIEKNKQSLSIFALRLLLYMVIKFTVASIKSKIVFR